MQHCKRLRWFHNVGQELKKEVELSNVRQSSMSVRHCTRKAPGPGSWRRRPQMANGGHRRRSRRLAAAGPRPMRRLATGTWRLSWRHCWRMARGSATAQPAHVYHQHPQRPFCPWRPVLDWHRGRPMRLRRRCWSCAGAVRPLRLIQPGHAAVWTPAAVMRPCVRRCCPAATPASAAGPRRCACAAGWGS